MVRAVRVFRLALCLYVVGWLALTPSSKLGGPWWACGLMACALWWTIEAFEALRDEKK